MPSRMGVPVAQRVSLLGVLVSGLCLLAAGIAHTQQREEVPQTGAAGRTGTTVPDSIGGTADTDFVQALGADAGNSSLQYSRLYQQAVAAGLAVPRGDVPTLTALPARGGHRALTQAIEANTAKLQTAVDTLASSLLQAGQVASTLSIASTSTSEKRRALLEQRFFFLQAVANTSARPSLEGMDAASLHAEKELLPFQGIFNSSMGMVRTIINNVADLVNVTERRIPAVLALLAGTSDRANQAVHADLKQTEAIRAHFRGTQARFAMEGRRSHLASRIVSQLNQSMQSVENRLDQQLTDSQHAVRAVEVTRLRAEALAALANATASELNGVFDAAETQRGLVNTAVDALVRTMRQDMLLAEVAAAGNVSAGVELGQEASAMQIEYDRLNVLVLAQRTAMQEATAAFCERLGAFLSATESLLHSESRSASAVLNLHDVSGHATERLLDRSDTAVADIIASAARNDNSRSHLESYSIPGSDMVSGNKSSQLDGSAVMSDLIHAAARDYTIGLIRPLSLEQLTNESAADTAEAMREVNEDNDSIESTAARVARDTESAHRDADRIVRIKAQVEDLQKEEAQAGSADTELNENAKILAAQDAELALKRRQRAEEALSHLEHNLASSSHRLRRQQQRASKLAANALARQVAASSRFSALRDLDRTSAASALEQARSASAFGKLLESLQSLQAAVNTSQATRVDVTRLRGELMRNEANRADANVELLRADATGPSAAALLDNATQTARLAHQGLMAEEDHLEAVSELGHAVSDAFDAANHLVSERRVAVAQGNPPLDADTVDSAATAHLIAAADYMHLLDDEERRQDAETASITAKVDHEQQTVLDRESGISSHDGLHTSSEATQVLSSQTQAMSVARSVLQKVFRRPFTNIEAAAAIVGQEQS